MKAQAGVLAKKIRKISVLKVSKISVLAVLCGRNLLDGVALLFSQCPNQSNFGLDSEGEWGRFQRGVSTLVCYNALFHFIFLLSFTKQNPNYKWGEIRTLLLHCRT